jgi:hypothetical protein
METRLPVKSLKFLSYVVVSLFAIISLVFFLISVDKSMTVNILSSIMLAFSVYMLWKEGENDSVSLLIFFFGTTACFYFFSTMAETASFARSVSIFVFAGLTLVLTNYLITPIKPVINHLKPLYKVTLAIVFTEIFWVLSYYKANPVAQGAITAIIFFNLQMITRNVLSNEKTDGKKIALFAVLSIILLVIIFVKI